MSLARTDPEQDERLEREVYLTIKILEREFKESLRRIYGFKTYDAWKEFEREVTESFPEQLKFGGYRATVELKKIWKHRITSGGENIANSVIIGTTKRISLHTRGEK